MEEIVSEIESLKSELIVLVEKEGLNSENVLMKNREIDDLTVKLYACKAGC